MELVQEQDLAEIARRQIEQGRFLEAENTVRAGLTGLELTSDHLDALYTLAVSLRYQSKFSSALEVLDQLLSIDPRFARAYQEKGHTLLTMNELSASQEAFEKAAELNPALLASWRALLDRYDRTNNEVGLQVARSQIRYLESLPVELRSVSSFIHEGKLYKADRLCRHFMRDNKQHVEGMRLLASIGEQLDVLADAEFLLETSLELEPDYDRSRYDFANLLLKMQKFEKALVQTTLLVEKSPDNLAFQSLHANALSGVGRHEQAIDTCNHVIGLSDGQQSLHVMRGHAEKTIGRFDDAIQSYRAAYGIQGDYGDAFWSLANTKTYTFTDEEIEHMKWAESLATISRDDRIHMCFALGKALEDRGDFEQSFNFYERGNELKREDVKHKPAHLNIRTQAQIDICSRGLFEERQGVGCDAPDPIFILGLPRAGSTLLEQILASHSQVDGTMELPNIIALAQRLRGSAYLVEEQGDEPRYPKILEELEPAYFARFGEQFIEQTRVYRQDAPFFIDKNPNNFFHIGLIRLILPNAKVIDARRHPMSCCFNGFKQLFGQGQEFSYGLREIGNYYKEYVELMDHWDQVLPGFVHRVQHEELVDDLEGGVRRLLDFCGLPFEQACIEYYKTERSVRTPSSEQVRQPIFRSSLEAWRNYEPWLAPLKEALGPDVRARYEIDQM
ncbi:MAG: sulfotransferase [Pseudomonadales bacterium]|nr:sulfotransferase [Pseudomonadales bacterium]